MKKKLNIFNKIKNYFKALYFNYITKPKWDKENKIKANNIKKEFEEKQKVSIERIKEIMFHEKLVFKNNNKLEYLNEKLVEGRANVIKESKYVSHIPAFYEPEICEIHNENLHLKNKTFNELILDENENARLMLKKQTDKIGHWVTVKPKTYFDKVSTLKTTVNNSMGNLTEDNKLSYQDFVDIDRIANKNGLTELKRILSEAKEKLKDE